MNDTCPRPFIPGNHKPVPPLDTRIRQLDYNMGWADGLEVAADRLQAMMASSTTRFADLPGLQTAIFLIQKLKEENHG